MRWRGTADLIIFSVLLLSSIQIFIFCGFISVIYIFWEVIHSLKFSNFWHRIVDSILFISCICARNRKHWFNTTNQVLTKLLKRGLEEWALGRPPEMTPQNSLELTLLRNCQPATIRKMGNQRLHKDRWIQEHTAMAATQNWEATANSRFCRRLPLPTPSKLNPALRLVWQPKKAVKGSWLQLLFCQPNPKHKSSYWQNLNSHLESSLKCCFHLFQPL